MCIAVLLTIVAIAVPTTSRLNRHACVVGTDHNIRHLLRRLWIHNCGRDDRVVEIVNLHILNLIKDILRKRVQMIVVAKRVLDALLEGRVCLCRGYSRERAREEVGD